MNRMSHYHSNRSCQQEVLHRLPYSRRQVLGQVGTGLGMLGLAGVLADGDLAAEENKTRSGPLETQSTHFPGPAKHIIHIYLNGGPSQVDTFDPKPLLKKYEGQPLPKGNLTTERHTGSALSSPFQFHRHGESGMEISEIFPRMAQHADEICVIRSMFANTPNHEQSMRLMNCGDERLSRPSLGSWITYGMGTENRNLPGFITMCPGLPVADVSNWRAAFLPGIYQGTYLDTRRTEVEELLENIHNQHLSRKHQKQQLELLSALNRKHQQSRQEDVAIEARIQSFELAFRMQMEATDAFDISREPKHVLDAYGDSVHGRQMLLARRLVERGVRFVQLYHGDVQPWDSHTEIEKNHRKLASECDGPIDALLTDLKQRGLLDETIVLCGGEFGRTPAVELMDGKPGLGRDHNHWGFSVWLAGAGVRSGYTHGATDDFGYRAVENRVHVHDLHATLLHLLGFDHTRLTYRHAGRDFRLTDVYGTVVKDILA